VGRKNTVPGILLSIVLITASCSRAESFAGAAGGSEYLAYEAADGLNARWEGTGFNPEGPAGVEGQTPPAFRDMNSLYGRTREAPGLGGMAGAAPENGQETAAPEKGRKLIKSARIQIRVENFEEAAAGIGAILERYQAYASNSSLRANSGSYTLKIPSVHYESVLQEIGNTGKVLHRSETMEDTTLRYYDLEGKLSTRLELLKTFQSYLGKANSIDEIMTVEKRIAELQQEIDWYGSQLADLSHLIDYATINLELVGPASESSYYKPTVKDRIGGLFQSFSGVASTALVVIVGILIFGIPALLIIILLFWILFGKIGLIRRIWCLVRAEKKGNPASLP
jgi:hypothetical protein